jgi:hypothetical protein
MAEMDAVHVSTHEWGQRTSRVVRSVVVIGMCTPSVHPTFGKHLTQCRMRACATLFLRHVRPCRTCLTAAGAPLYSYDTFDRAERASLRLAMHACILTSTRFSSFVARMHRRTVAGSVAVDEVAPMVERFVEAGVAGLYVPALHDTTRLSLFVFVALLACKHSCHSQ